MHTLQEIRQAVDQLSKDELADLRIYIQQREQTVYAVHLRSPEERIALLERAAQAIHKGFSDAEWTEIEQAMNEEYIEPWDEAEWRD